MPGGDGTHLGGKHVPHIQFRRFARQKVALFTRQAGHFADQGNALGFGGDHHIVLGNELVQFPRAGHGQFRIAENDEGADHHVVADGAERKLARQAGDLQGIVHIAHAQTPQNGCFSVPIVPCARENVKPRRARKNAERL